MDSASNFIYVKPCPVEMGGWDNEQDDFDLDSNFKNRNNVD